VQHVVGMQCSVLVQTLASIVVRVVFALAGGGRSRGCGAVAIGILIISRLFVASAPVVAYSVEYYQGNSHSTLTSGSGVATYTLSNVPLVLTSTANVNVGGTIYNYANAGLYRVYNGGSCVRQTLVYGGDDWQFAGHLSRIHLHGDRHNDDSMAEWDALVRDGTPVSVTCSRISPYTISHLQSVGVQARLVRSVTLDAWNDYDNSHTMLEVHDTSENRWILYDVTLGETLRFRGHRLNLLDTTQLYRGDHQAQLEILNSDSLYDPLTMYTDPAQNLLMLNHDEPTTQTWYHRVLQVPIINGYFAVDSAADADRIRRAYPSWTALSPAAFHDMFYPGEPIYVSEPASMMMFLVGLLPGALVVASWRGLRRKQNAGRYSRESRMCDTCSDPSSPCTKRISIARKRNCPVRGLELA
jgi:hypothetical protein